MDEELVFRKVEPKDVSGILNMYNDIIDNFDEENNYLKWEKMYIPINVISKCGRKTMNST